MDATEAAVHFARALSAASIPHAIGGAIAYGFFGVARGTHDVDINLFVPGEGAAPALRTLIEAGLEIDEPLALQTARDRGDARGLFHGMPVDLFFNSIPVHERAATRSREVTLHGAQIRVLSPEDTAVFKMLFFRGKDLVDLERLLGLMGKSLDAAYVRAALVEVVGEDDYRTKKWDDLVRQLT
ncbi:MAG: hypothetical protein QM817_35835 [Archangium sp.]